MAAGDARDRGGVLAALREAGLEVTRQGKDYVTGLDPDRVNARWRLKGRDVLSSIANDTAAAHRELRAQMKRETDETRETHRRMAAVLRKAWLRPLARISQER